MSASATMPLIQEPLISVVLCTRNRAELLRKAIRSIVEQDYPRNAYELLIIDNGSTDHTQAVTREFERFGNVRHVLEPQIGLCIARNTGWKASRGRFIAYFDDDAIASPGWLAAVARGFEASDGSGAAVGVLGGRVRPIWERVRPAWLADEIAGSLTIVDWGPRTKAITDLKREWLVGANMAVPRSVLEEIGGFHPWLDRVGSNLLSSGDVFLQKEIVRRGYRCLYVPEMAIDHLAAASRLNKRWFRNRFYWQGISDAVMHLIDRSPSPVERVRAAVTRLLAVLTSRRKLTSLITDAGDDPVKFKQKCLALIDIGFVFGLLGAAGR